MASPILNLMSAAAIKAGKGLLRDFSEVGNLQVSRKGTANFVTSADIRTEKLLQQELKKARPEYGFLLEEGGEVPGRNPDYRWIIDPLDGTTNFIHAIPYFCTSIALEKRDGNGGSDIIAGVIFDPIHNELFAAEKGQGATVNDRKLSVSNRDKLEEAMLVAGNPRLSMQEENNRYPLLDRIAQSGAIIRYFGATALDLANLAAGRIDACWYYTIEPWDIAAGLLLVQEAGGFVMQLNGQPATSYSRPIMATNRHLQTPVHKLLAKAA